MENGDFSKRVYQGVRVKHTVKDLLAEKRSQQTSNSRFNGGVTSSQSPFTQVPGSPVTSGFYGVRRSFLSDSDFHGTKQYPGDNCSSSMPKAFPCEPSVGPSHPALLDPYFPEPYGDHRPSAVTPSPGSLFSASSLPPLLPPPFPGDPAHLVLRDTWEQMMPEGLGQPDPVPSDTLPPTLSPGTSCLSQLESGSTAQHRSSSWASPLPGTPSYSLHALEDLYHSPGYPTPPSYPFGSFMTVSNEQPPKMVPDEGSDTSTLQDASPWTKEDGSMVWGSYECRRAY